MVYIFTKIFAHVYTVYRYTLFHPSRKRKPVLVPEPTCSSTVFGCVCWVGSIGTRIPRWFTAPKLWKIVLPFNMHVKIWNPSLLLLTKNSSRSPTNDHGMIIDPRIASILFCSAETFPAKLPWLVRTTFTLLLCSSFCRETVHSTIYPPAQDSKKTRFFLDVTQHQMLLAAIFESVVTRCAAQCGAKTHPGPRRNPDDLGLEIWDHFEMWRGKVHLPTINSQKISQFSEGYMMKMNDFHWSFMND